MRMTLAALIAVGLAAAATPAAACNLLRCAHAAMSDDTYPAGEPRLPAYVKEVVKARDGRGLSLAGFYNDPSVAMAHAAPPPQDYYVAAPEPAYLVAPEPAYEPAPQPGFAPAPIEDGYERHSQRPQVILSPFGRREDGRRYAQKRRERPNVY